MLLEIFNERFVYFDGNAYSYKDMIKAIPGAVWDKVCRRKWAIPIESIEDAKRIMPSLQISSEVLKAYQDMKARNSKAVAVKTVVDSKIQTKLKGLKGTLYPYQGRGRAFLDTVGDGEGGILAFDMGLGKSLTSLAAFLDWKQKGIVKYCLVICPSPLKYSTWDKEIKKWTDLEYCIVDGDKTEKVEWDDNTVEKLHGQRLREVQYSQWQFGCDIIVMNYELFLRDMNILPPINGDWAVILDECQRIKNPKAQTTKNILKVCKNAGRKIPMSGTPLENSIPELWSIADLCRPGIFGNSFKFTERYCLKDFFGKPIGAKPELMGELRSKMAPFMIRVTKKEALPDLPPLTIQDYWVDMTEEQRKFYKMVKDGILENITTGEFSYLEILAQITRLQQVVDSPYLLHEVMGDESLPKESGKLNELKNVIEDLDPMQHKFILFSQYREMTGILYDWMIAEKLLPKERIGYIHGGLKPTITASIQNGFQGGNIQCVLMTTAGNYGLDLSAGSYVIAYDQLFNPQKMEQVYSRAHRNGVKQAVTAIRFMTRGTYEEKKLDILESKKELFKAMIDADDTAFAKLFSKEELISML